MKKEWCPKCGMLQNVNLSETKSTEKDEQGNEVAVFTESSSCAVCHTFIMAITDQKTSSFDSSKGA